MEDDELIRELVLQRNNAKTISEYNIISIKIDGAILTGKQFRTLKRKRLKEENR